MECTVRTKLTRHLLGFFSPDIRGKIPVPALERIGKKLTVDPARIVDFDYDTEERIDIMKNTLAEYSKFIAPAASDKRIRVYNQFKINAHTAKEAKEYTDTLFSAIPAYIRDLDRSCGGKENLDVNKQQFVY